MFFGSVGPLLKMLSSVFEQSMKGYQCLKDDVNQLGGSDESFLLQIRKRFGPSSIDSVII
jgi:hypothetical protein